ncbi:MAG: serine hydrolase [Cyclobacteriaceae bacterium]
MRRPLLILIFFTSFGCLVDEDTPTVEPELEMYFPSGSEWKTYPADDLGWDTEEEDDLHDFLESNGTRAFIVLKQGRIVMEKYWGQNIAQTSPFTSASNWYWASAGKTLTATLTGIAQQEGRLSINDKTSDYLGSGWTDMPQAQEEQITIRHQLTMTTGLDYEVNDIHCTDKECLTYKADAGTQWYYHNAPYTLLEAVISEATGIPYNDYTDQKLESKIGMDGMWIQSGYNNVYWSTPRDAARFGLLMLNRGKWNDISVLEDSLYFDNMISTSQELNPAYGYLWWLNGKSSVILPGSPASINMAIASNAPDDLYAAMGKNGQFIDVVPSEGLVVVRMGEAPDDSLVPVAFHNQMWGYLSEMISVE